MGLRLLVVNRHRPAGIPQQLSAFYIFFPLLLDGAPFPPMYSAPSQASQTARRSRRLWPSAPPECLHRTVPSCAHGLLLCFVFSPCTHVAVHELRLSGGCSWGAVPLIFHWTADWQEGRLDEALCGDTRVAEPSQSVLRFLPRTAGLSLSLQHDVLQWLESHGCSFMHLDVPP